MSATARLVKAGGAAPCAERSGSREEVRDEAEAPADPPVEVRLKAGTEAGAGTVEKPDAPDLAPARGRKGITYRGQCIFCGERIEIAVDRREIVCFAFCNAECKAKFEADMNQALE
ncbi:MAG: hypothetical protein MUC63_06355 [Planctomycetes bacterium]|jgi:RNA polymerase-binding transcription factor DksA|nr:hypothetical protein [Planctomycetota bacterium]